MIPNKFHSSYHSHHHHVSSVHHVVSSSSNFVPNVDASHPLPVKNQSSTSYEAFLFPIFGRDDVWTFFVLWIWFLGDSSCCPVEGELCNTWGLGCCCRHRQHCHSNHRIRRNFDYLVRVMSYVHWVYSQDVLVVGDSLFVFVDLVADSELGVAIGVDTPFYLDHNCSYVEEVEGTAAAGCCCCRYDLLLLLCFHRHVHPYQPCTFQYLHSNHHH
mmetsp:Transcript_30370/g.51619  ORF Transcript_30370/g.51619 Transcript_30370/m.51619 type:complete len:214 (+) Transcript_30370:528-1169(+)